MIKTTIIIALVVALFYKMDIGPIVHLIDNASYYWNEAVISVSTFKDRWPLIMAFMPFLVIILLCGGKDARA